MILMNCASRTVFNLENTTHIQIDSRKIHLLSKRELLVGQEYLESIVTQLYKILVKMPHIFVLPSFLFNMDHVEHISYQASSRHNDENAMIRFTNGNMMLMLPKDVAAFHQLVEGKASPATPNIIRPG